MRRFLLDTNAVVFNVRGNPIWKTVESDLNFEANDVFLITSTVVKGELRAFSVQHAWGEAKIRMMEKMLESLFMVDIVSNNEELINAYSAIDAFSQGKHPTIKSAFSARNMGKNDLWIAATAHTTNAVLITSDHDFDHLDGVFLSVKKIAG